MPSDRLLTTVLGAFQRPSDPEQISRILSSTTSLLTTLSNPLNVTLLTSQLLQAPAIWSQADGLSVCFRVISIFNTAAITVRKHNLEGPQKPYDAYQPRQGGGINCDEWARAVVKGADERSSRWQHVLLIAGVLLGMEGQDRRGLSWSLRSTLEVALVSAVNLALDESKYAEPLGMNAVVLALNHAFPLLSDGVKSDLDYDALVLMMVHAMTSREGYEEGLFLDSIDGDVRQIVGNQFEWSAKSASFLQLQKLASKPLVASMGPLSRLTAHTIIHARDPLRVLEARDHLLEFTGRILSSWQRTKLSEIDPSEESTFLSADTLRATFPVLWQVLKTTMFATVVVLQAIVGRTLLDPVLAGHFAPSTASHALKTLRNIHFISCRLGSNAFSAYTFVNLTSIDILSRYPSASRDLLKAIYPSQVGQIPIRPLDRNLDLFYLNTCEHFTLTLSAQENETLIVTPASPYLNPTANANLREIFEAAHSAVLAVLASPQAAELTARIIPFYVDALFNSFPANLSPRQFRFAFKTLMQITTPPSTLSATQPHLAETLLELLHYRAIHAPTTTLSLLPSQNDEGSQPNLSEQAVLLLTLLDALPNLPIALLGDWLPLAADLLNAIEDGALRESCKARFWEVLEGGEMDVERSAVCVRWWSTRGGRERVLYGDVKAGHFMSGGLGERDGSRL